MVGVDGVIRQVLYTCMHVCKYICVNVYKTHIDKYTHASKPTTHTHTHIHTHTRARTHTHTTRRKCWWLRSDQPWFSCTRAHTYIHAYTHTHARAQKSRQMKKMEWNMVRTTTGSANETWKTLTRSGRYEDRMKRWLPWRQEQPKCQLSEAWQDETLAALAARAAQVPADWSVNSLVLVVTYIFTCMYISFWKNVSLVDEGDAVLVRKMLPDNRFMCDQSVLHEHVNLRTSPRSWTCMRADGVPCSCKEQTQYKSCISSSQRMQIWFCPQIDGPQRWCCSFDVVKWRWIRSNVVKWRWIRSNVVKGRVALWCCQVALDQVNAWVSQDIMYLTGGVTRNDCE